MGDVKDLAARDAIVKMKEIADGEIAMRPSTTTGRFGF